MKVLALDPGVTTGWALATFEESDWLYCKPDIASAIKGEVMSIEWGEVRMLEKGSPIKSAYDLPREELYRRERRANLAIGALIMGAREDAYDDETSWDDLDWGVGRGLFGDSVDWPDSDGPVDVVVIEDFTVYPGLANEVAAGGAVPLIPVGIGAAVGLFVELMNVAEMDEWGSTEDAHLVELSYVMASMAKTTVTDERLKRWGLWARGSGHSRDAIRHLVTYLR